jgi:hypothetical protein
MSSKVTVGALTIWVLATGAADAQWIASVSGGANAGGAADQTYPRAAVSVGWWAGNFGLEVEGGIVPLFFESEPGDEVEMVVTVLPKVVFGLRPLADGVTPFVFGGLGLVSYALTDSEDRFEHGRTHAAMTVGGGVMTRVSERFGLRGEGQYIRALEDVSPPGDFRWEHTRLHFWTFTGGVVVRF